jgi:hypothetical protein
VIHSPAAPQTDLASATPGTVVYGVDEGDQLGHVPATGDFDGDGKADLLLTAVSADGPGNGVDLAGEAVLVLGAGLSGAVDVAAGEADAIVYGRDVEDRLGRSAATGDVNGDGKADILLGAPGGAGEYHGAPNSGEIYVLLGPAPPDGAQMPTGALVFFGDNAGDSLASAVFGRMPLAAADIDGDGRDEILVAAPMADGPDGLRRDAGQAMILFVAMGMSP